MLPVMPRTCIPASNSWQTMIFAWHQRRAVPPPCSPPTSLTTASGIGAQIRSAFAYKTVVSSFTYSYKGMPKNELTMPVGLNPFFR